MVFIFKVPVRIRKTTTDTDNVSTKMLRAHYISLVGTLSHMSSPTLPNPDNFGRKINEKNNICYPVMTLSARVLDSAIQLALCLCKGGCSSRSCRYAKKAPFVQKCVNALTVKIIKTKMSILLHMLKLLAL